MQKTNFLRAHLLMLTIFFAAFQSICQAQEKKEALVDYFPAMPASIDNSQLRAMADNPSKKIPLNFYPALQLFDDSKFAVPIGKIETKKTSILLYAEIDPAHKDGTEALVRVTIIALDKKSGNFLDGSTQRYVAMSGDDALHHEANIRFSEKQLSIESKEGAVDGSSPMKTETDMYVVGKKYLELTGTK